MVLVNVVVKCNLVPRSSTPPVLDHMQCSMQKRRDKAWEFHHMICGTADIADSKCNSLFAFLSTATEKLENSRGEVCPT